MSFTPYKPQLNNSSFTPISDSMIQKYQEDNNIKERNLAQKAAGFLLDPIAKLATETGNFAGKGIVRGIEQFQSPEQKAITEANLQKALNTPSQVPGLGTEVKPLNKVTGRDVAGQVLETAAMFIPGEKIASGIGGQLLEKGGAKLTPLAVNTAKAVGKIITGAGTGYAFDVAQQLQNENKTLGESFIPGISTVVGTTLPIIGTGIEFAKNNLPTWFTKGILPKLKTDKNISNPVDETLQKLDYGSIDKNLSKSAENVRNMGNSIDTILQNEQNINKTVDSSVINDIVSKFPRSKYTPEHILSEMQQLVPEEGQTIDKIANGTASVFEANQLKKALYDKTSKVFENVGTPPARKEIGATFATTLANYIKDNVSETQPIFNELSKEINLRNSLIGASKKAASNAKLGLYDIAGYFAGGIPAVIGEKFVRSPGVQLGAAKVINKLGKSKVIPQIAEVAKKATLKTSSSLNN